MNLSRIISLKGEFEAEGLTRDSIAAEAAWAARHGLPYLVKIGGCEAKSDMHFLLMQGIDSIVAPMIESAFAMRKYQAMLPSGAFKHVGVTIETVTAVERIEDILDAGCKLSEVTVGRSDLTASFGGGGVNCPETISMVKTVARAARTRGLKTTMGGTINTETCKLLLEDDELRDLIACVETRKCVMPVEKFLEPDALKDAFAVETALLEMQISSYGAIGDAAKSRKSVLLERL
jgi:4-hydroxy-2-oxoheptanedioate aldolase